MALTVVAAVEAIINAVDQAPAPLTLNAVRSQLAIERQAMQERGASAAEDASLWSDLVVYCVYPSFADDNNPWGSFFRPQSSGTLADGRTVYMPDITEAGVGALAHWSERARGLRHPVLKARYADVVWEFERTIGVSARRDVAMARLAIDAYVDSVAQGLVQPPEYAFTCAQRAIDLAAQINDEPRVDAARAALLALHSQAMADEKGHLWARAYDHLVDHRKARVTPNEMGELARDLETVLKRVSDSSKRATFDPHATWEAAQRLARHYARIGKPVDASRALAVAGQTFEFVAGQGDAMLAASFLQDSMAAFQQAGMVDEAARIRVALQGAIRDSGEEMEQHGVTLTVPKEAIESTVAAVVGADAEMTFSRLASAFLPKRAVIQAQVARIARAAPLLSMLTQQVFAADHVAAKIGSVGDDELGRLVQQAIQNIQMQTPFLDACVRTAIDRLALDPAALVAWLNRNELFEPGKIVLLKEGLAAWFAQDHVKALHVLVPQIENALRRVVSALGRPTTKPAGTVAGVSVAINMGDIVFNADTVAVLGPRGEDLALYLKAIYVDPRGMNLRNRFAHGLLDADAMSASVMLWIIHTLLVIGGWEKVNQEAGN